MPRAVPKWLQEEAEEAARESAKLRSRRTRPELRKHAETELVAALSTLESISREGRQRGDAVADASSSSSSSSPGASPPVSPTMINALKSKPKGERTALGVLTNAYLDTTEREKCATTTAKISDLNDSADARAPSAANAASGVVSAKSRALIDEKERRMRSDEAAAAALMARDKAEARVRDLAAKLAALELEARESRAALKVARAEGAAEARAIAEDDAKRASESMLAAAAEATKAADARCAAAEEAKTRVESTFREQREVMEIMFKDLEVATEMQSANAADAAKSRDELKRVIAELDDARTALLRVREDAEKVEGGLRAELRSARDAFACERRRMEEAAAAGDGARDAMLVEAMTKAREEALAVAERERSAAVADAMREAAKEKEEALAAAAATVRLLPIRPRSRGARRSLRTSPVVTLHPRFPFNVRPVRRSTDRSLHP